jgi:hypothetical protein
VRLVENEINFLARNAPVSRALMRSSTNGQGSALPMTPFCANLGLNKPVIRWISVSLTVGLAAAADGGGLAMDAGTARLLADRSKALLPDRLISAYTQKDAEKRKLIIDYLVAISSN